MKRKRNEDLPSWGEAIRLNFRAVRLLGQKFPHLLLSRTLCAAWSGLTPFVGIWLSAQLIGELTGGRSPERLAFWAGAALLSAAVIALVQALLIRWRDSLAAGMWVRMQNIFTGKLLDMDYASLEDTRTHDRLAAIKQSMGGGGWGLYRMLWQCDAAVAALFSLLGGVSLSVSLFLTPVPADSGLAALNHPLTALAVIAAMLAVTLFAPTLKNRADRFWASSDDEHRLGNRLFSFYGFFGFEEKNAADIRMYEMERFSGEIMRDKEQTFGSNGFFARLMRGKAGALSAASAAVATMFTAVAYLYVCLKALGGAFGVGMVAQYVGAITKLSGSVAALVANAGEMRVNAKFLRRIFEFMDLPDAMQTGSRPVGLRAGQPCEIEFRDVSFRYPGSEDYALRHVNMRFSGGDRMAVVGQNGSGKTTFIKLLCRLYEPTEGQILLNGRDIREYDYAEYLKAFAVVFQDFQLFAFPLGENVAGRTEYDASRAEDCLEKAGFGERLKKMP